MPGISDKNSLRNAILDTLSVSKASSVRLKGRGALDPAKAIRLRKKELELFEKYHPHECERFLEVSKGALTDFNTGNHFVYKLLDVVMREVKNNDFLIGCRSKTVTDAMELSQHLLSIKAPRYEHTASFLSTPDGYQKVIAIYISLRTLIEKLMGLHSRTGKQRGDLQRINTSSRSDEKFEEKLSLFLSKEERGWAKQKLDGPYSDKFSIKGVFTFNMSRLSDIIYIRVSNSYEPVEAVLTPNHYERFIDTLKKISNVLLGTFMSYSLDDMITHEFITVNLVNYIRKLFRLGVKDDLAVGEAGKAVTDLLKAKLSQTDELPWSNYAILRNTYSDKRQANAEDLWDAFYDPRVDPDILINASFVWKLALQPDSDIRKDFRELVSGLSKPNPVSEDAPEIIEMAIKRSVLIGALRENRQVHISPATEGGVVPKAVSLATAHSSPTERELSFITYGMMRDIKMTVSGTFPDVHDVDHLMFKDKSSSVSGMSLRKNIKKKNKLQLEISSLEDKMILANAHKKAKEFFESIKPEMDDYDIDWRMRATANDILTSFDDSISRVFKEAETKFKMITRTLDKVRESYGKSDYMEKLREWMKDYPELLINTATEPKYGEVHKRSVRIFYMFEKEMKTYLSQFERMARLLGYYIKGAEIVKGDRAREQHMNVLSSAHRAWEEGILAYQILFDLSKFSQKFNHLIIDAAARVIAEITNYDAYSHISDLFKASFLYVSARNVDEEFTGVLGAYEGFLNFLWTDIHATVMDIALKSCGRSGDLAAYSDDGLMMFTMSSKPNDSKEKIQAELTEVIDSLTATYNKYGLDFNLGKTLISRTLAEFLGVIVYKGRRFPVWMKELCKLGVPDDNKMIRSYAQEVTDISAQMAALIKAGMPPHQASQIGYLEIMMGPGRRVWEPVKLAVQDRRYASIPNISIIVILIMFSLNPAFGGIRIPDPINMMVTSDFDPISEMLKDLRNIQEQFPGFTGLRHYLLSKVKSSTDYLSLLLGSSPVSTTDIDYYPGLVSGHISKIVGEKLNLPSGHPLSRRKCPRMHEALEALTNLNLPSVNSLMRYAIPVILHDRAAAPSKSSSIARLIKKGDIRKIQSADTKAFKSQVKNLARHLEAGNCEQLPTAKEIYSKSFPRLDLSEPLPSLRDLVYSEHRLSGCAYSFEIQDRARLDEKGSYRLMNMSYTDDLVPPLVTTDVNIKHLINAPDVMSHCARGIFSELLSASAQGHDVSIIAYEVCRLNKTRIDTGIIQAKLRDLRKIAVANRKKHVHRVYWSEATKSACHIGRHGELNYVMTQTSDLHYSQIITVALGHAHYLYTCSKAARLKKTAYVTVNRELAEKTKMTPMKLKDESFSALLADPFEEDPRFHPNVREAIKNEVLRSIDAQRQELVDNLLMGRMGMIPDLQSIGSKKSILDPLRYATVWSLVKRLDALSEGKAGVTGVFGSRIRSYALENIPMDIANLAIIYRTYKSVHKSKVGQVMKTVKTSESRIDFSKDAGILDWSLAEESLNLAGTLNLYHSLTNDKLRSISSVVTYNSMLIAQDINLIYYSLDSRPETNATEKISPARAKAMQKVVNAVISRAFEISDYSAETDSIKIILMGISGSMRGSVHRDQPFNHTTYGDWMTRFMKVLYDFYNKLPHEYKEVKHVGKDGYNTYMKIPESRIEVLDASLREFQGIDIAHGVPSQYDQLIKFLLNLARWGSLPNVVKFDTWKYFVNNTYNVYNEWVKPALTMVRTVSYSTVEKAAAEFPLKAAEQSESNDYLAEAVERLTKNIPDGSTYSSLLSEPPGVHYRLTDGPFDSLGITVKFPDFHNSYYGLSMGYSLSVPLLLSAGYSSYKDVIYLGVDSELLTPHDVISTLQNYSLPHDDDKSIVTLGVITGLAEVDIVSKAITFINEFKGNKMLTVEIPPSATAFSLGLIQWMSLQTYSFATTALSSDLRGVSIYMSAIVEGDFPFQSPRREASNTYQDSLGDLALKNYIEHILSGNYSMLSALSMSPLHHVGIPVYTDVTIGGRALQLTVEEELIDRHRVSFVETGKPSESSMVLAKMDTVRTAYIIRARTMFDADNDPSINAVLASYYYYRALFPDIDQNVLCNFLVDLVSLPVKYNDGDIFQHEVLSHTVGPIVALPEVSLASMPVDSQMVERDLEIPDMENCWTYESSDKFCKGWLGGSGRNMLDDDMKSLVVAYLRLNQVEPDPEAAYKMIKPRVKTGVKRGPRVPSTQKKIEKKGDHYLDQAAKAGSSDQTRLKDVPESIRRVQEEFKDAFAPAVVMRLEKEDEEHDDKFTDFLIRHAFDKYSENEVNTLLYLSREEQVDLMSLNDDVVPKFIDEYLQKVRLSVAENISKGVKDHTR